MTPHLTAEEIRRYQRHLSLSGFGPHAQARLKASTMLVIGAGGLGCPALLYLAAAGVGEIILMDADRVDVSNLQRQILFTTEDAGVLKVEAAGKRLHALNPLIRVTPVPERISRENAIAWIQRADVVVDGSDNFATRYLVNDACVLADRPLIYGAIRDFSGQVSVFNWQGGPTYRCLFPEPPPPGSVPTCSEAGVLGVLPGLVGSLQATEALKALTGIGQLLSGRLLIIDALTARFRTVELLPNPASREITDLPAGDYGQTCSTDSADEDADEIDVATARRNQHAYQWIDVRESVERVVSVIDPSVHIPLGRLHQAHPALQSLDPDRPTIAYCAAGIRSLHALDILRQTHRFTNVRSLRGGIREWKMNT
ncbi:MAG: HesA/MoeB/ThiF family protein [Opitutales bacterium]|nr:HesA/MoeB/ThiF family protein [Opitutales bacterium]